MCPRCSFSVVVVASSALTVVVYLPGCDSEPAPLAPAKAFEPPRAVLEQARPGARYFVRQKVAALLDVEGRTVGDAFGGAPVTAQAGGGDGGQSVTLEGWVWSSRLANGGSSGPTSLNADDGLWNRSLMPGHGKEAKYRLAILRKGTSVEVLASEEACARVVVRARLPKEGLTAAWPAQRVGQGGVRDKLGDGRFAIWLTDVVRATDFNPVRGATESVKIILQVTNETEQPLELWAVRTVMFGKDDGEIGMTTVSSDEGPNGPMPFALSPRETKSWEFDHDGHRLLPYANRAKVMLFLQKIDPRRPDELGAAEPAATFYFSWDENDIRGEDVPG